MAASPFWYSRLPLTQVWSMLSSVNQANLNQLGYDFATGTSELKNLYKAISLNLAKAQTTANWDNCTHLLWFSALLELSSPGLSNSIQLITHLRSLPMRVSHRASGIPLPISSCCEGKKGVLGTLVRNKREAYVTDPYYHLLLQPLKFILCKRSSVLALK